MLVNLTALGRFFPGRLDGWCPVHLQAYGPDPAPRVGALESHSTMWRQPGPGSGGLEATWLWSSHTREGGLVQTQPSPTGVGGSVVWPHGGRWCGPGPTWLHRGRRHGLAPVQPCGQNECDLVSTCHMGLEILAVGADGSINCHWSPTTTFPDPLGNFLIPYAGFYGSIGQILWTSGWAPMFFSILIANHVFKEYV